MPRCLQNPAHPYGIPKAGLTLNPPLTQSGPERSFDRSFWLGSQRPTKVALLSLDTGIVCCCDDHSETSSNRFLKRQIFTPIGVILSRGNDGMGQSHGAASSTCFTEFTEPHALRIRRGTQVSVYLWRIKRSRFPADSYPSCGVNLRLRV